MSNAQHERPTLMDLTKILGSYGARFEGKYLTKMTLDDELPVIILAASDAQIVMAVLISHFRCNA